MASTVQGDESAEIAPSARRSQGAASGIKAWRTALAATSSIIALAAGSEAQAANECGVPAGGIVTCGAVSYPTGISYNGVDDLTVNVGSFAGQTAPVVVGGEINIRELGMTPSQILNVGGNTTINSTTFGESVYAGLGGSSSYAAVTNHAALSSIDTGISAQSVASPSLSSSGETVATALANIVNTGSLTTTGANSDGIVIKANSNAGAPSSILNNHGVDSTADVTLVNSGAIVTSGDNSIGISATTRGLGYSVYGGPTLATATLTNNGNITTSGNKAYAIYANTFIENFTPSIKDPILVGTAAAATTIITNTKALETSGRYASGIVVVNEPAAFAGYHAIVTATATVTNSGIITTSGYEAHGIVVMNEAAALGTVPSATVTSTVNNTGTILVTGGRSDGISVETLSTALSGPPFTVSEPSDYTASVTNSGSVSASGVNGAGVVARTHNFMLPHAPGGSISIVNAASGSISGGTGESGAGIAAYGGTVYVANSGRIGSLNNQALFINAQTTTIYNQAKGTITGFITAHAYSATLANTTMFDNKGTWVALGGNSDFTPAAGGSSILVNYGAILVTGNQTLVGLTTFDNAGLLSLSATNANAAPRPQFEKFIVTGDFVGENGVVEVGSNMTTTADVLQINGTISGSSLLKIAPEGPPGLTTGNGILVVDASTGTTSATNFKILSNDSNGTFVDGAYQYSLVFDAGPDGHGQWFLTSKAFGGLYPLGQVGSFAMSMFDVSTMDLSDIVDLEADNLTQTASNPQPVRLASNDDSFVPTGSGAPGIGGWARFNYASLNIDPSGSSFSDYHMTSSIGHFAIDETIHANGQTGIFGITGGPVSANASFDDFGVRMHASGYYLGGYGVWLSGPWMAGILVDYASLDTGITDAFIGTNAKVQPDIWGFQSEVRYRARLGDDFTLEPWSELSYARVNSVAFMDGAGANVDVGATESIDTRFGALVSTVVETYGTTLKPYADLGLDYQFDGRTTIVTGGVLDETSLLGATGHFGGGLNALITDRISVFGQADYLAGQRQTGWTGFVGLRYLE